MGKTGYPKARRDGRVVGELPEESSSIINTEINATADEGWRRSCGS